MKVLIVEDERELLIAVNNLLTKQNFICELASNYKDAEDKIAIYEYDIILLDITLPDGSGLDLLEIIKKFQKKVGIIIISAKNSLDDKINGLDLGADDYITKPFHLSELNSRIKALIRRSLFLGNSIVTYNELQINTEGRTVTINNRKINLTTKEYDLLLYFVINQNRVLTKEVIVEHLWGDDIDLADNFDFIYTHINNIRKKIKMTGGTDYIHSIYGLGYKFSDQ